MPFASIYPTDQSTNPWIFHEKYWEVAVLKNSVFLSRPFWNFLFQIFFSSSPWKSVKVSWLARMGRNLMITLVFSTKQHLHKQMQHSAVYLVSLFSLEIVLCISWIEADIGYNKITMQFKWALQRFLKFTRTFTDAEDWKGC